MSNNFIQNQPQFLPKSPKINNKSTKISPKIIHNSQTKTHPYNSSSNNSHKSEKAITQLQATSHRLHHQQDWQAFQIWVFLISTNSQWKIISNTTHIALSQPTAIAIDEIQFSNLIFSKISVNAPARLQPKPICNPTTVHPKQNLPFVANLLQTAVGARERRQMK